MFEHWFPEQISEVAAKIDHLFWFTTSYITVTAILVFSILGFFIIRYHYKRHPRAYYTHGNTRGALMLTGTLAVLVFLVLDVNFAYQDHKVWVSMFGTPPPLSESLTIEIMPEQFAWNIRYAGPDGRFNTPDDITTMNDLHIPVNKPVHVQMASKDVIHSFFLPNMRIKQDVIPGMVTALYFMASKVGAYNIACAEHCGLGHYRMRGDFVVQSQQDFDAWLSEKAKESTPAAWGWEWKTKNKERV